MISVQHHGDLDDLVGDLAYRLPSIIHFSLTLLHLKTSEDQHWALLQAGTLVKDSFHSD